MSSQNLEPVQGTAPSNVSPCSAAPAHLQPARAFSSLKDRLFECMPAGRYALAGLLRLLDVVETDAVPTAAVECQAQPRLLINPGFVARHAATPEKLMMLVCTRSTTSCWATPGS